MEAAYTNLALFIALTTGITEAIKRGFTKIPSGMYPLIALSIGTIFGFYDHRDIIEGIVIGLSSAGLYSGTRTVLRSAK